MTDTAHIQGYTLNSRLLNNILSMFWLILYLSDK